MAGDLSAVNPVLNNIRSADESECIRLLYKPCAGWGTRAGFADVRRKKKPATDFISCLQCLVSSLSHHIGEDASLHASFFSTAAASHPWMVPVFCCTFESMAEMLISYCLLRKKKKSGTKIVYAPPCALERPPIFANAVARSVAWSKVRLAHRSLKSAAFQKHSLVYWHSDHNEKNITTKKTGSGII